MQSYQIQTHLLVLYTHIAEGNYYTVKKKLCYCLHYLF